jgi:hypothetical protein
VVVGNCDRIQPSPSAIIEQHRCEKFATFNRVNQRVAGRGIRGASPIDITKTVNLEVTFMKMSPLVVHDGRIKSCCEQIWKPIANRGALPEKKIAF